MKNLISLFIIATDYNSIKLAISKILYHSNNVEIFVLNLNHLNNLNDLNNLYCLDDSKISIINDYNTNLFNTIFDYLDVMTGEFICILNDVDVNHPKRFNYQSKVLEDNKNINICSCLEEPISYSVKDSNFSNDFITSQSINFAVMATYIPLDLYTFMIRKSLLKNLHSFNSLHTLKSELDFILFLLLYSSVEKIDKVLYYYKNSRIPYRESINIDDSYGSSNIICKFNQKKSIESRDFMYNSILKKIEPINSNIKYHILVFIENLNIGGTETYLLNITLALKKIGIESHIITSDGILMDLFIRHNINVIKLDIDKFLCEDFDFNSLLLPISNIIQKYNIKLFTCHLAQDIAICIKLKKYFKIKFILTIHGNFYQKDYIKDTSKQIDGYVFVSTAVKDFYKDTLSLSNNYLVLENSISSDKHLKPSLSLHERLNIPKNARILVYCSRLSPNKSFACINFLKCFDKLSSKYEDIYAVILGEGQRKVVIESFVKTLNAKYNAQKIFLLGSVYDVWNYYNDSFFVVGTGRVALEAINCSKAVIALGLAGCIGIVNKPSLQEMLYSNFADHTNESISNDLNSLESYINLSFEKLNFSMDYLLSNPDETTKIGSYCKSYCDKNLNLDTNIHLLDKFFEKFI